jgi:hypothetical protein
LHGLKRTSALISVAHCTPQDLRLMFVQAFCRLLPDSAGSEIEEMPENREFLDLKKDAAGSWGRAGRARTGLGTGRVGT